LAKNIALIAGIKVAKKWQYALKKWQQYVAKALSKYY
jgi:hypothetical protein